MKSSVINKKPTNPKDVLGVKKLPYHLFPNTAVILGVLAMLDGAAKYGRSNYRALGVRSSIYYDAARRHLDAWFEGEDNTDDGNIPHLGHALACISILIDAEAAGVLIDDRMYPGGYKALMKHHSKKIVRIRQMHKNSNPHHYSLLDKKKKR